MWIYINFLLLLLHCLVTADVNISYVIKNYQNPYNLDSRLRKCEALNVFGDHCDPFFHFAAYTTTDNRERRSTLRKEAGPFVNSKFIDHVLEVYEVQSTFPDTIEIELDIQDSDIDEDQRIALFRRTVPLETKGRHEFRMGVDVKVEAHIEITCTKDYYGQRCDVYCIPLHDLWTCDKNTGARLCSKPCLHGKCVLTSYSAVCECITDWQGEFCQTPIETKIISTILAPDIKTIHVAKPIRIDQSTRNWSRSIYLNNKIMAPSVITTTTTAPTTTKTTKTPNLPTTIQSDLTNHKMKQMTINKTNKIPSESTSDETVKIVQLKFDNLQKFQNNPLATDSSNDKLVNHSKTINSIQSKVSRIDERSLETVKESDGVVHPTGQYINNETRNYLILAFIIMGLLLWLIGVLIIGLVCYRRRRNRKVSVRKSALWSNISYEPNLYQTKLSSPQTEPFITQYNHDNHQNDMKLLLSTNQTIYPSLKRCSPNSVLRNSSTLPKPPNNDHPIERRSVRYTRTPNDISKLHFGTTSTHTPPISSINNSSMSMYTQQSNLSPIENSHQPPCDDTYEELTCCRNDHYNWKHNHVLTTTTTTMPKLTTFQ